MAYLSFEKLTVWERSSLLYGKVNSIPFTPKHKHLQDQLLRSSLSISSNIAEGYERMNPKEVIYFLNVAKGSCGEARSQIRIAGRFGIIEPDMADALCTECQQISAMLYGLIQSRLN
jgi:four helix bundle protein